MNARDVLRGMFPAPLRRRLWALVEGIGAVQQRAFERRLGVSTGGHVYLDEAGSQVTDRAFYEGCQWLPVRRALRAIGVGPEDVFVDLGSGKGQALLIAASEPYRRVIGVELLEDLTAEAERNLSAARPALRAGELETVTADVLQWPVPDDLSVVFLYCPFMNEVFYESMHRIFAYYDRRPRPLHIVYAFPWEHNWLMRSGRVVLADVLPAQWPARPWWWRSSWVITVYRVVAQGEAGPRVPTVRRRLLRPARALARWSAPNQHVFRLTRDDQVVARSVPDAPGDRSD